MNPNKAACRWRNELEGLLATQVDSVRTRARTAFDDAIAGYDGGIVILGAGNLGRKLLRGLCAEGIQPLAFSDNNPMLWGTRVDDIPVLSPGEVSRLHGASAVFVLAIWRGETQESMGDRLLAYRALGCQCVVHFGYLFWKYPERFLPHFALDLPHRVIESAEAVRAAFDCLADDISRELFVQHVHWRLHLDFKRLPPPQPGPIYFREELFESTPDEVFIDCGAFDGDTLEQFIEISAGCFAQVHCFEADPLNALRLSQRYEQYPPELAERIHLHAQAVGARSGRIELDATGTVSSVICERGGVQIDCVMLDEALVGERVSLIKMDIEGYEPEALKGAQTLIRLHAPVLAICIYHVQDHLWSLPLQLAALNDGYRLHLRAHVHDGWDLVCYAVPVNRAVGAN